VEERRERKGKRREKRRMGEERVKFASFRD